MIIYPFGWMTMQINYTLDKALRWKGGKFMTRKINGSLWQPFSGFGLQLDVSTYFTH